MAKRFVIKIAGESGQGINSIGETLARALKNSNYYVFGYREYPSLIKGGNACYQVEISDEPINSPSKKCDLLLCISRKAIWYYLHDVAQNGTLIHSLNKVNVPAIEQGFMDHQRINFHYVDALEIAKSQGGNNLMVNVVLCAVAWKILKQPLQEVEELIKKEFANKPELLAIDLKCLQAGYGIDLGLPEVQLPAQNNRNGKDSLIISGNEALGLGAIAAGARAYYGYPMTPTSTLHSYVSSIYKQTGMLVKQAEDEITAVQMAIGSMFMGTRALVATSGGGFDLMTETVSLAGITETPLVILLGQRPGPATGMPTWTAQGDLNLAIYGGHGEFPRCVIAASDAPSAYTTIQHAYNIAEKYQIPVIVLTEKQIAESLYNLENLPTNIPINRHLVGKDRLDHLEPADRFKLTENGISLRWLPGEAAATYLANSDEHLEDGTLTEEALPAEQMIHKRMRKEQTLLQELAEPEIFGPEHAQVTFVGWGSVKTSALDAIEFLQDTGSHVQMNYLHFEYLYPLRTEQITKLMGGQRAQRIVLLENNYAGQLGNLIRQHTGFEFKEKLLRYDGRPIYFEDIIKFINHG